MRDLITRYSFWCAICCPIALIIYMFDNKSHSILDYVMLGIYIALCLFFVSYLIYEIVKIKKREKKHSDKQPTCWTLGYSFKPELGFDDGTYLIRKAAKILYPEYFNELGEPRLDMLDRKSVV